MNDAARRTTSQKLDNGLLKHILENNSNQLDIPHLTDNEK